MSNVAKAKTRSKRPAAGTSQRGKIGRDFFAVLVVGLGFGLSFAWMRADVPSLGALINKASTQVQELASDQRLVASDEFPVSSIGDKTRVRRGVAGLYPVCADEASRQNCVVDGDTFHMNGVTIRVSDIDAPETRPPRCALEADLGDRATTRLSELLSAGPFQLVRQDRDVDKYGRQLRVVIRNGRSVGRILVGEGLARPWTGKRRPWCDARDTVTG